MTKLPLLWSAMSCEQSSSRFHAGLGRLFTHPGVGAELAQLRRICSDSGSMRQHVKPVPRVCSITGQPAVVQVHRIMTTAVCTVMNERDDLIE